MTSKYLLAALLWAAIASAFADPPDQDQLNWLKTMAFATHQTEYTGTFVYQYDNHVETSRITHITDQHGEYGRLEGLDGNQREIIHNNNRVWCYVGGRMVNMLNRQGRRGFPVLLPEQLSLITQNYRIKQAEQMRVAGMETHAFILQPRDTLRYTHKMWAHNDSGLLVKAAILDDRGRIVEQYAFTQLTIGGNIDRKWLAGKSAPDASAQQTPLAHTDEIKASGWQVHALPWGFKKTMEMRRSLRDNKVPVTHLVFSDGLAGISVFIENVADHPNMKSGLSSQGAIQIYSKVDGEYVITVVGEVPPHTMMQVADSVRYKGR